MLFGLLSHGTVSTSCLREEKNERKKERKGWKNKRRRWKKLSEDSFKSQSLISWTFDRITKHRTTMCNNEGNHFIERPGTGSEGSIGREEQNGVPSIPCKSGVFSYTGQIDRKWETRNKDWRKKTSGTAWLMQRKEWIQEIHCTLFTVSIYQFIYLFIHKSFIRYFFFFFISPDRTLVSKSCVWQGHCTPHLLCHNATSSCNLQCCVDRGIPYQFVRSFHAVTLIFLLLKHFVRKRKPVWECLESAWSTTLIV